MENTITEPRAEFERRGSLLGHPRGLYILAGTEMWERLSFYGLQALVAYFVYYSASNGGLGLPSSVALGITGAYGGAVYLLQPVGAWIADRVLAARYVVLLGGIVILAGHLALAFLEGLEGLLAGLGLIVLGTGLLTPSIYAMVGALYKSRSKDLDGAFSIFYGSILIGAFIGPLVMGLLQTRIGFHVAFSFAAIGMGVGLIVYVAGWKLLPETANIVPNPVKMRTKLLYLGGAVAVLIVVIIFVGSSVITFTNINTVVLMLIGVATIACFASILTAKANSPRERKMVISYIPVFLAGVVFEMLFLSIFTTLAVYADTRIDLQVGGFEVPPSYISSFEVLAGIAIVIVSAVIWKRMGSRQPSSMSKLIGGLVAISCSYVILALLPLWHDGQVSILPVMFAMAIFALGEVTFTPMAMSLASQSAPQAHQAQMMAIYSLSMAAGASLSGAISQFYSAENEGLFFGLNAAVGVVAALLLVGFYRFVNNRIKSAA